ncbi:PilZ domain-containing protein [Nitrospira sp. Kam-Ns4a]
MDRRETPRTAVELTVLFATPEGRGIGLKTGKLFNLSVSGCAMSSATPLGLGTDLALFIKLPNEVNTIKVDHAAVRWVREGDTGLAFGLEFVRHRHEERQRLLDLVARAGG